MDMMSDPFWGNNLKSMSKRKSQKQKQKKPNMSSPAMRPIPYQGAATALNVVKKNAVVSRSFTSSRPVRHAKKFLRCAFAMIPPLLLSSFCHHNPHTNHKSQDLTIRRRYPRPSQQALPSLRPSRSSITPSCPSPSSHPPARSV